MAAAACAPAPVLSRLAPRYSQSAEMDAPPLGFWFCALYTRVRACLARAHIRVCRQAERHLKRKRREREKEYTQSKRARARAPLIELNSWPGAWSAFVSRLFAYDGHICGLVCEVMLFSELMGGAAVGEGLFCGD